MIDLGPIRFDSLSTYESGLSEDTTQLSPIGESEPALFVNR